MKKYLKKIMSVAMLLAAFNLLGVNAYAHPRGEAKSCPKCTGDSKDVAGIILNDNKFKTLKEALEKAGLLDTLKGKGPFTVFAPTDAAFEKLPKDVLEGLLKPENKEELVKLLNNHVAPGMLKAEDIAKLNGKELELASGNKAKIEVKDKDVYINGAKVIVTDIVAKNGVIHVIDTVITNK